jgi:hypothetical protein
MLGYYHRKNGKAFHCSFSAYLDWTRRRFMHVLVPELDEGKVSVDCLMKLNNDTFTRQLMLMDLYGSTYN